MSAPCLIYIRDRVKYREETMKERSVTNKSYIASDDMEVMCIGADVQMVDVMRLDIC